MSGNSVGLSSVRSVRQLPLVSILARALLLASASLHPAIASSMTPSAAESRCALPTPAQNAQPDGAS